MSIIVRRCSLECVALIYPRDASGHECDIRRREKQRRAFQLGKSDGSWENGPLDLFERIYDAAGEWKMPVAGIRDRGPFSGHLFLAALAYLFKFCIQRPMQLEIYTYRRGGRLSRVYRMEGTRCEKCEFRPRCPCPDSVFGACLFIGQFKRNWKDTNYQRIGRGTNSDSLFRCPFEKMGTA